MAAQRNLYHIVAFDPGGTIGWAHFVLHKQAFTSPRTKVLRHLLGWRTGEISGNDEFENVERALDIIQKARYGKMPFVSDVDAISEQFDLVQTIGGNDLLSPVRINAMLNYGCRKYYALELKLQARQLRTSVTPERLNAFGFKGKWVTSGKGKDAFAAMQHAVVWLRRTKQKANERPWKLEE